MKRTNPLFSIFIAILMFSASIEAQDFTAVAKVAIPATVFIKVKGSSATSFYKQGDSLEDDFFRFFFSPRSPIGQQPAVGQASGFIISPDGYLITNSHVVRDAAEIIVVLQDGRELLGKLVGQDPNTDIAIVKIEAHNLPFLQLGNSDSLEIGQWAIAVGNPYGLQASLTVGVISAKGRTHLDLANFEDFIQTDAAINRGNSGGPLLNIEGKVIGMNTAIVSNLGGGGGSLGIGFAIPSNMIQRVKEQIINNGKVTRGFIGIVLQQVDHDLAQAFDWQGSGALVADISKGSPAEKAGIQQGDIIQSYDKIPVSNMTALRNAIALSSPGTKMILTVVRKGQPIEIPVVIGNYPETKTQKASVEGGQALGFEVQDLSPQIAESLGLGSETGVIVSQVDPNSLAAIAGLKKRDLIMTVNQKKVASVGQFEAALQETPAGRPLLLLVKQGETIRFISIKIG